jgi:hypothetical protein
MKQIRDSAIFRVEPLKDILLIKLFTFIAVTWFVIQMCIIAALSLIAKENNYHNIPVIIPQLTNLAGLLTMGMPISIIIQDIAGLYFNRLRRREKSAEYKDFIENHFQRMR